MSQLFSPLAVGPLTLRNRLIIAPICQYSAIEGLPQPWHWQHLGRMALSGAGLVIIEATGVEPEARITADDLGLWNNAQEAEYARLIRDLRTYSDVPVGIQLAHAGRKASTNPPWIERGGPAEGERAWTTSSASALPFKDDWHTPVSLDEAGMARVVEAFVQAAQRADRAGFDLVELHAAHGYLLTQFLSPISNLRTDDYGGSLENRMRFPLRVAAALREAWPRTKTLGARFNGSDWVEGGVTPEEAITFGQALHLGYDFLHLSSGGNVAVVSIPGDQPGYQLPFAAAVKAAIPDAVVIAVGMIVDPHRPRPSWRQARRMLSPSPASCWTTRTGRTMRLWLWECPRICPNPMRGPASRYGRASTGLTPRSSGLSPPGVDRGCSPTPRLPASGRVPDRTTSPRSRR